MTTLPGTVGSRAVTSTPAGVVGNPNLPKETVCTKPFSRSETRSMSER